MPHFFPGEEILPKRDEFQGKIGCGSGPTGVPYGRALKREQPKTRRRGPAPGEPGRNPPGGAELELGDDQRQSAVLLKADQDARTPSPAFWSWGEAGDRDRKNLKKCPRPQGFYRSPGPGG